MTRRLLAALACVLALAGCGGSYNGSPAAATTTSTSSTTTSTTLPPPGIDRFIAEIQASGYGARLGFSEQVNPAQREAVLKLGDVVCDEIGKVGYESMVKILMDTQAKPTEQEATAFIDSALRNICPSVRP